MKRMMEIKDEQQAVIQDYRELSEIDKKVFKAIVNLMMVLLESRSQNEQS